jgi:hypothetical protein
LAQIASPGQASQVLWSLSLLLMKAVSLIISVAVSTLQVAAAGYSCASEATFGAVVSPGRKGLSVDDTTFVNCSQNILQHWPHTGFQYDPAQQVKSIRVFKPWDAEWPQELRQQAWRNLVDFVHRYDVQVLLGTSIGCKEAGDRQIWEWAKELIQLIGHEHLMGLAIGNELEIYHRFMKELHVDAACLQNIWDGGYAWYWFQKVVSEFDAMGYVATPITSVFGGLALAGNGSTFYDIPEARVDTLLSQISRKYKERFVFTFNFYPYFDPTLELDENSEDRCSDALESSLCFQPECNLPYTTAIARRKMTNLTGNPNWRMWLGELGWSARYTSSLKSDMSKCKQFSSLQSFQTFYKGFLGWNLSISNSTHPLTPPEHVFWFTMRDSYVFGILEYFGMVSNCSDITCKIRQADVPDFPFTGTVEERWEPSLSPGHLFAVANSLQVMASSVNEQAQDSRFAQICTILGICALFPLTVGAGLASASYYGSLEKKEVFTSRLGKVLGRTTESAVSTAKESTPMSLRSRVGSPVTCQ